MQGKLGGPGRQGDRGSREISESQSGQARELGVGWGDEDKGVRGDKEAKDFIEYVHIYIYIDRHLNSCTF